MNTVNPKARIVRNVFYIHQYSEYNPGTKAFASKGIWVYGDRTMNNGVPQTGPDSYGHIDDTPENRVLAEALLEELKAAEADRNIIENDPHYADGAKKTFRKIAEDFWERNSQDVDIVFAPLSSKR